MDTATEEAKDTTQKVTDCSWDDFLKSCNKYGFNVSKYYSPSEDKKPALGRAYQIRDIAIKNGTAIMDIVEYGKPYSQSPAFLILTLTYEVTQLNLPHLGKHLRGHNFRVETVAGEKIGSPKTLDGKYLIQVEMEDLKFK